MKHPVARLLAPPVKSRRNMSISLEEGQMAMVEKLSVFLSQKANRTISKNHVVEEAVRTFSEESADYICQEYDFDIRSATMADLQEYRSTCVKVLDFDTVIVPAKDNDAYRKALLHARAWGNVRIDRNKLDKIKYVAIYVGAPTSGIQYYAKLKRYYPALNEPEKYVLEFDGEAVQLAYKVVLGDLHPSSMRSCRYTTLELLLQAQLVEELF